MSEVVLVVALAPTESQSKGEAIVSPPRSSYTLLIVEATRWHIREVDGFKAAYVHSRFHGRSDAQDVDAKELLQLLKVSPAMLKQGANEDVLKRELALPLIDLVCLSDEFLGS